MKQLAFIFILLSIFSCKKENNIKTIQDYVGSYTVQSTKTKFIVDHTWTCYTGMDSLEMHIADSLAALIPLFTHDTIYTTDTILIIPSKTSKNKIIVIGLFDDFGWGNDSAIFYKSYNSNDLEYLHSNNNWVNSDEYTLKSSIEGDDIQFNFKTYKTDASVSFTYEGLAKKLL